MNKQQLASKIWASANKMRSKIEANEYKDYILGFIFYRYLSTEIENFYHSEGWSEEDMPTLEEENDPEYTEYVRKNRGYFIGYKNLFSTWLNKGTDFGVKDVSEALSAFNRLIYPTHKKVFSGIFNTLETGLKNLGDSDTNRSTAIRKLIQLIKDIPMDGNQGYDVLGYIYEYLISNFAASAGKKAGEFYTPHEVSVLMAEIVAHHLRDREKIEIYDPTSGSGSLLITIGRAVAKHNDSPDNIKYYAQELKRNTYNLTRMNLVMRGIKPNNIITRNGDTLEHGSDWPMFEDDDKETSYEYRPMDAVVSNPPYSQEWDRPSDKDSDPRYKDYGLAPKKKADYAFLLHDLYHLKSDGIMAIVLPHGVLFRPGDEAEIRRNLIEQNKIEAIIGLPADIFFGTPIATIVMVLKANRDNTDVLFIDASKYASKDGKKKKLQASDIKRIFDAVTTRPASIDKFARLVSLKEILENEYDLNIPKYVDSSDAVEKWDLYSSLLGGVPRTEIELLKDYWEVMPALKSTLFPEGEYVECLSDNVGDTIRNHDDIKKFQAAYNSAFGDYEQYLIAQLIDGMMTLNVAKEVDILGEDLFGRLSTVPLLDRYAAFQALNDCWEQTATDIEIIQTEGIEVLKKIEPNMVIVKNGDEEDEVQKGWKGRIMPFDLVQRTLLPEYLDKVNELKNQLAETVGEVSVLLEEAGEEDSEILTDDGDAFDNKKVKAQLKLMIKEYKKRKYTDLPQFSDGSMEAHIIALTKNADEQKRLKAEIKDAMNELEVKTIFTIESLSEDQIRELLRLKWVMPVVDAVKAEHTNVISTLIDKVEALVSKYSVTLNDVEKSISYSESKLSDMVVSLRGNDFDMKALESFKISLIMASKVPEIRFAGFEGDWDKLPLSEYLTTSKAKNRDNTFGKEDVLSVSREFGVINQIEYQGRSFAGASVTGYGIAETNDIIYTKSPLRDQPYGIIKTNKGVPGIVSALYAIYHPNDNIEPDFIQTFFDKDKRLNDYLRPLVHKGAKNTLNVGDDEAILGNVIFPKRDEQVKITESFKNIDALISHQVDVCEKLRNLRAALLTSLLPQGEETKPRVRLDGFTEAWTEKSLDEIITPYKEIVETPHDGYDRLGIRSHGKGTFHSYVPKGAELETAQMGVVRPNNLIVNITFGWELAVAITEPSDEGKLVSHRFPQFSFKEKNVPIFFRYALINNRFRKHLTLASPGSAGRNRVLKIDKMLEYKMLVPAEKEQKAISDILSGYDRLIQLNEQKLDKLRNLKQAMLDKMFV